MKIRLRQEITKSAINKVKFLSFFHFQEIPVIKKHNNLKLMLNMVMNAANLMKYFIQNTHNYFNCKLLFILAQKPIIE